MERIPIARRSARVERLLREHAGGDAGLLTAPLSALLADPRYSRALALKIEALARDPAVSWPLRRIAALLFETALSRTADDAERAFWLERLGMTDAEDLQRQGYVAGRSLPRQVWRRLARMSRLHRLALDNSDKSIRDYLHGADRECRLTFARYLFGMREIINRIERQVRRSAGRPDPGTYGQFTPESERAIANLPALERRLVEHLKHDAVIRWAALNTSTSINSLVEMPVGTVVLTIKPPGSFHELEIKRAGKIRELPLDITWARDHYIVPSSHHLDGGSMHHLLAFEAENSAFLSKIFRQVHGFDAAMSRSLTLNMVYSVATRNGQADLVDYFTSRQVFGPRYDEMRAKMHNVCRQLASYGKEKYVKPKNDLILTTDFIARIKPAQVLQLGTTSFRLDRLERYLGAKGAHRYFREGRNLDYDSDDARRFADELLDEILGEYEPPRVPWRSHKQYVAAAFAVPANRRRANHAYVSILEQIGRFWGTLMGIRGHAQGESFVARNTGIRSVWEEGEWKVRMVFMDHDALSFASVGISTYKPRHSMRNEAKDAKYILGGKFKEKTRVRGEFSYLKTIYRVGSVFQRRGLVAFRAAMKDAYDRTQEAMRTNPEVNRHFRPEFIEKLHHWDDLVRSYLALPKTRSAHTKWKIANRERLVSMGYKPQAAEDYVGTVTELAMFLRRMSFLFSAARTGTTGRTPRPSRTRRDATSRSKGEPPRPMAAAPADRRPAAGASRGRGSGRRPPAAVPRPASRSARRPQP